MVPPELAAELGDYTPEFDSEGLIASTGQIRLATSPTSRHMRSINRELLKMLALLQRRKRTASEVAALMGKDLPYIERLLGALSRLDLIDEHLNVTPAGAAELAAGKQAVREVAIPLKPSNDVYYPSTLR
jgi:hypothetical protein